jgi:hypothetical protein
MKYLKVIFGFKKKIIKKKKIFGLKPFIFCSIGLIALGGRAIQSQPE